MDKVQSTPHFGFVADRSKQPAHQWWYLADEQGPIIWKERTPQGKRWRSRGGDGAVRKSIKGHFDTDLIGPYRFAEYLSGHVIILAGETDTETAQRYTRGDVYQFCSMPFSETTTKGLLTPFDQATKITILYDADSAGRKGARSMATRIMLHRQESGLAPIPVGFYAGEGESGIDLKDTVAPYTEEMRPEVVSTWIQNGVQQSIIAEPPPPPDPCSTDGNYPSRATHEEIGAWMLQEMGAHWEGLWEGLQVHYVHGAGKRADGRWISFQGGRWREIDFRRVASEFIRTASVDLTKDITTLRSRIEEGFLGKEVEESDVARIEGRIKHLDGIRKSMESQHNSNSSISRIQDFVGRDPSLFDQEDLVAGAVPHLGDATESVIEERVDVGSQHPARVFNARTGEIRNGLAKDHITRGLGVVLPDDVVIPDEVTVEGLAQQDTPAEEWIMTYCPKLWEFICQISSYYPDIENPVTPHVDLEVAALLVETAGLCLIGTKQPFFTILFNESGRNGKGVFAEILHAIAGELSHKEKELLEYQLVNGHSERVARVAGKHLVHVDEPNPRIDIQRLKQFTGGGDMAASLKGGSQFSFRPTAHILITSNRALYLGNPTDSLRMRMTVIPCEARFGEREEDMYPIRKDWDIYSEVEVEYSHFALLALTFAHRALRSQKRAYSTRAEEASLKMFMEVNPVSQWLGERIKIVEEGLERLTDLHADYKKWCKDLTKKPKPHKSFITDLKQVVDSLNLDINLNHRPRSADGNRPYMAKGIRLLHRNTDDLWEN